MSNRTTGKKILVVDDEKDILWPLQAFLLDEELRTLVLTAASGEEALVILGREPIDLVITDIKMPGISGLDLLVEIKNRYPYTAVMVMTAFPSMEFKREALLKGGVDFVEKPFDIKAVREKALGALRQGGQFRGFLSGISLADVIQIKCMSGVTGSLGVRDGASRGMIFFSEGEIVHALSDQLDGEAAFYEIMAFGQGQLDTVLTKEIPARTIFQSPVAMLMEASRRQDEEQAATAERGEVAGLAGEVDLHPDRVGFSGYLYRQLLRGFRRFDGYRASAVVGRGGQVLAEDCAQGPCDLAILGAEISGFFRLADAGLLEIGLEGCNEAVLGTGEGMMIVREGGGPNSGCLVIALFAAAGNQARVRLEMKKIVTTLNGQMAAAGQQDTCSGRLEFDCDETSWRREMVAPIENASAKPPGPSFICPVPPASRVHRKAPPPARQRAGSGSRP
ncbi:MAG: response regulator [Desulfobulbaceae bacterium]|nr:response regulator [Desulfobulbaceae bacterium]